MAKDIFISYRRHDSSFFAARLRERLEGLFPDQVFLDVSGIDAGDDFVDRLKAAVSSSKAVIAVIGPGWASSREGQATLGDEGDFVTEEIATALEAGIPIVPVLVDGARMPSADQIPVRLQGLPRRNAVSISHERFDSDVTHLVAGLYKPLGIRPPNRLERILELAGGRASFSQRTRDQYALGSVVAAVVAALLAAQWILVSRSDPLEILTPFLAAGLALALGFLGRNSLRRRLAAAGAIVLSIATLVLLMGMGVWRGLSLPRDPWFEAAQIAQRHVGQPEIPAERIAWSTRAAFTVPPPTVDCPCFSAGSTPTGPLPYVAGVRAAFTNQCGGPVTFVVSRSTSATLTGFYPWFAASGREFAVITLAPQQSVHVPLEGTYGGAYQPWVCQQQGPVR